MTNSCGGKKGKRCVVITLPFAIKKKKKKKPVYKLAA